MWIIFSFPLSVASHTLRLSDIMADFVSEKKISEFQNAFFYFAHDKTGVLKAKQMGDVMRYIQYLARRQMIGIYFRKLGQNPAEAELQV